MISQSERPSRPPLLRLQARHGQVVCLLRPRVRPADPCDARLLALIASGRAPFLRCWRLYGPAVPAPRPTPSAA